MAAPLQDLSFYTNRTQGGISADEANGPRGQALLAELRKYDPGANFSVVTDSQGNQTGYTLNFDGSKIPGYDPTKITTEGEGFNGRSMQWSGELKDPTAVTQSDLFGTQTSRSNLTPQKRDWFDYVGPAAVGLFAFGIPAIAGAMSEGAIGGAGAAAGAGAEGGAGGAAGAGSGLTAADYEAIAPQIAQAQATDYIGSSAASSGLLSGAEEVGPGLAAGSGSGLTAADYAALPHWYDTLLNSINPANWTLKDWLSMAGAAGSAAKGILGSGGAGGGAGGRSGIGSILGGGGGGGGGGRGSGDFASLLNSFYYDSKGNLKQ